MSTICVDPRTDPRWLRLIEQHESSVFHSPDWMRVLADTYGLEMSALLLLDDSGEAKAGIPFCQISDIAGERIVTLPFSDYCDPLVRNAQDWKQLIDRLLLQDCSIAVRCLRNGVTNSDKRLRVAKKARWHGLDLRPDIESIWQGIHPSARWGIHKAQRSGVEVRCALNIDELMTFYELHLKTRKRKYRLLAQPYSFFLNIWRNFIDQDRCQLMFAVHQDQVIGAVFFLIWKRELYYKFSTSVPDSLSWRPNELLMWKGIEYGKDRGLTHLDLGLSDWDQEGLIQYKRKFASDEKDITFLKHTKDCAAAQRENQARDLFNRLTSLLTDKGVSDDVSKAGGEALYRFLA